MKHLFLSYSRKDTDVMTRVRDTLRAEGFEVWTDEKLTPGTDQWSKAIQQAIRDAYCVVVLLSPDSNNSKWVANEIGYAETCKVPIFPILVRGEERDSVPIELIRVQRIDIRSRFLANMQILVDLLQDYQQSPSEKDEPSSPKEESQPVKVELTQRHFERYEFWSELLEKSKHHTRLFANVKPKYDYWLSSSAGRSGLSLSYVIAKDLASTELYIDVGVQDKNKAIFDRFFAERETIEHEFGDTLEWERLDHRRASRIIKRFYNGGRNAKENWPQIQDQLIDAMIRLDKVFRRRIQEMKINSEE
jgi:hypothetical protein